MALGHNDSVKVFKALADENRLEIIEILMSGAKCGCELLDALEVGQSTLSHHMHILCEAGLVDGCKEGKWMHYSLSAEGSAKLRMLADRYSLSSDAVRTYRKCDSCKK